MKFNAHTPAALQSFSFQLYKMVNLLYWLLQHCFCENLVFCHTCSMFLPLNCNLLITKYHRLVALSVLHYSLPLIYLWKLHQIFLDGKWTNCVYFSKFSLMHSHSRYLYPLLKICAKNRKAHFTIYEDSAPQTTSKLILPAGVPVW